MQKTIYKQMLNELGLYNYRQNSKHLCAFNAQKGLRYKQQLMVVGRAVNGWGNDFQINDIFTQKLIDSMYEESEDCPMEWVLQSWGDTLPSSYNTKKSAFWRVIKALHSNLYNDTDFWASELVWSNLYKIAPFDGGNPPDSLCDYQFEYCNKLLKAEILEYLPDNIIFFTGMNWFHGFLNDCIDLKCQPDFQWVDGHGTITLNDKKIKFVVVKHPQGKPETELVQETILALSMIN
ncbi:hypothetical protein [Vibrio aphrogenes]|uniref:hypothetical protein n=1 Tax=Vibrio aphrogenes TaxID=1891186 RepID=UPI000B360AA2|nr:hypothetical protein [Vibrio aphrogenes]